jgi:DNA-directed RNA polymerase subunit RPC12/RpoP
MSDYQNSVNYICIQCGNDNPIKSNSTKESIKCITCGYRILIKSRNLNKPSLYKAR